MDLSKVLGDVYSDDLPPATAATPSSRPVAPEWADEAHLDEAFAGWTPGPPADAPAAEREMAAHVDPGSQRRIDDDLAAALTQALSSSPINPEPVFADHEPVDAAPEPVVAYELAPLAAAVEVEVEPEPTPAADHAWARADDDVLPAAARRRGLLSRLSR